MTIEQPKNAKEMFAVIRRFFDDPAIAPDEQNRVYNALAGVRGPDSRIDNAHDHPELYRIKETTTAIIRHTLLGYNIPGVTHKDDTQFAKDRQLLVEHQWTQLDLLDVNYRHFISHAQMAFAALELNWDEVNK
jgi:hypothetical protein